MNWVVQNTWFAALVCGAAGVSFAQTSTPATPGSIQAIKTTMTCAEFISLLKAKESQTVGFAIQWLDGFYSSQSGRTGVPEGWNLTLSQGVGGTCAVGVNAERTVLDVVGEVHQRYDPAPSPTSR